VRLTRTLDRKPTAADWVPNHPMPNETSHLSNLMGFVDGRLGYISPNKLIVEFFQLGGAGQ